jgi:hypothetical protein
MVLVVFGCAALYGTYGKIEVGHPQVFTRERLVKERLREAQWLEAKLKDQFESTFQGYIDQRSFVGLYEQLQASYSPLKGRLSDALLREDAANVARQSQLNALDHNIRMLQAEASLNKLRQDVDSGNSKGDYTPQQRDSSQAVTKEQLDVALKGVEEKLANFENKLNEGKKDLLGIKKDDKPSLPSPASIETTQAKLSAIERLNDERAYRQAITAMMRKEQLDDIHDLYGATLYDFKFDLSLIPGSHTTHYAEVRLELTGPNQGSISEQRGLYTEWARVLQNDIAEEAIFEQRNLGRTHSPASLVKLANHVQAYSTQLKRRNPTNKKELEQTERCLVLLQSSKTPEKRQGIACAIKAKYMVLLSENDKYLVSIMGPQSIKTEDGEYYINEVIPEPDPPRVAKDTPPEGMDLFLKILTTRGGKTRPYVSTIEPTEYVQNISDVAARESLTNLVLALSASLPNGIGAEKYSQYVERSEEFLHAVKRQPLAIAFNSHAERSFGWILGPRYTIETSSLPFSKSSVAYYHAPVRHSFSATISAPAWSSYICLKGTYSWIGDAGQIIAGPYQLWGNLTDKRPGDCNRGEIEVNLSPEYTGLTQFLIGSKYLGRVGPKLLWEDGWVLENNSASKQVLLVHGREVWRNPQVLVGSFPAAQVEILPNMQGLIAYFDNFSIPLEKTASDSKLDLTVVTPFGRDTLNGAVKVTAFSSTRPRAEVLSRFVIANKIPLKVRITSLGERYGSLVAKIASEGSNELQFGSYLRTLSEMFEWSWPNGFVHPSNWENVKELKVKVEYKKNEMEATATPIAEQTSVIYFKDEDSGKLNLVSDSISVERKTDGNKMKYDVQNALTIKVPHKYSALFFSAYPGLEKQPKVMMRQGNDTRFTIPLSRDTETLSVEKAELSNQLQGVQPGIYDLEIVYSTSEEPVKVDKPLQILVN